MTTPRVDVESVKAEAVTLWRATLTNGAAPDDRFYLDRERAAVFGREQVEMRALPAAEFDALLAALARVEAERDEAVKAVAFYRRMADSLSDNPALED